MLAKLANSTRLRLLSGALGAAPAAGIKHVPALTLVKASCVGQPDFYALVVGWQCLFKDDMVARQ
jgi:hypothetical protein